MLEARKELGVDAEGLEESVRRNNDYARTGHDLDFHKGETPYDIWQGDPEVGPNPALGPINEAPFHAVVMWPGNLGTTCGLVTDDRGRVLDVTDSPIAGLYACGSDLHSVFSGFYPGGGSSLGPAMTFGHLAALDALKSPAAPDQRLDTDTA